MATSRRRALARPFARRPLRRVVAPAIAASWLALSACTGGSHPATTPTTTGPVSPTASGAVPGVAEKTARPSLIFGAGNAFRLDISKAPVARTSKAQMAHLMSQITPNYGGQVGFSARQYNSSMYVATAATPKVRVAFDNCQKKPDVPPGLYDGPKYFVDVPIPETARASSGSDAALTVWSPSQDALWEFWVAKRNARTGAWSACWGGRIDHVSTATRGAFAAPYGASASGLATVGSMVSIAEARALSIEHAVQISLLYLKAGEASYPADRSDGMDTHPAAIPLGTRLRLPASVDVNRLALPPLGKAIARAAQRYGFIVTETSGAVAVGAEGPNATLAAGGKDPWDAILGATNDWDVLKGFPWARLEVVQQGYGAPTAAERVVTHW